MRSAVRSMTPPDWPIRRMAPEETAATAKLWLSAWRDGHLGIVPDRLAALRTEESFAERLAAMGDGLRVAGPKGAPVGLCAVKGRELYQLFVARETRGTGLAARLLADGEARLAASGVRLAELDCTPGNERAAAFYAKHGWRLRGEEEVLVETVEGPFPMMGWMFEKRLA